MMTAVWHCSHGLPMTAPGLEEREGVCSTSPEILSHPGIKLFGKPNKQDNDYQ